MFCIYCLQKDDVTLPDAVLEEPDTGISL